MRSSTAVGLAAARGRFTSMPRYIIGAVSMKMRRSTRTTSTSGMMLISARDGAMRAPLPVSALNAIFRLARQLRGAAHHVEEVEHERVHFRRPVLHAVDEEVVGHDRRDGGAEAGRRRDEGLGDARRDDRETRRALRADAVEGGHDAEDGAEEAD